MMFSPSKKCRVIDCVADTGIDVSCWSVTEGEPASNPKYCYEWSYGDVRRSIFIFNVWKEEIDFTDDDSISIRMNARKTAEFVTVAQSKKYNRARKQDKHLRKAFKKDAAVRIIVLDGDMGSEVNSQRVHLRELDPVAWRIHSYDKLTGAAVLYRGQKPLALAS